jgi:hypothetical protein
LIAPSAMRQMGGALSRWHTGVSLNGTPVIHRPPLHSSIRSSFVEWLGLPPQGQFCWTLALPLRVRLGRVSLSRACHPHPLPVPPLVWHRLFFHRERTTARTSETFPPRPAFCGRPAARRIRFSWHSGSSIRSARRFPGLTARIGIPSLSRVWPMSG